MTGLRHYDKLNTEDNSSGQNELAINPNSPIGIPGNMLIINKAIFLKTIGDLKKVDNLTSLRTELSGIISQITAPKSDKIGLLNIDENGDTIKLSREYIFQELTQIQKSQTMERAKYYIERLENGITKKRTSKINDINLNRWKEYSDILTDSLWILNSRDNTGVHTAGYWGNFIPQIPHQMIKRYTKRGEWVLDSFAGCGTTLIEAQRLGRNCIGIELQEEISEKAGELVRTEANEYGVVSQIITGDSLYTDYKSILAEHKQKSVQFLIMHPPYFDIIKFSEDQRDLCNAPSVEAFLQMMRKAVDNASEVLDKGRYFALVIGDKYSRGEWIPLGFLTMNEILKQGFLLKSIIVKNFEETTGKRNKKELWRYRALVGGFYIFKHEYIFLFKKK